MKRGFYNGIKENETWFIRTLDDVFDRCGSHKSGIRERKLLNN